MGHHGKQLATGCHYNIPHTVYSTKTEPHNTVLPIIRNAACGGVVRANSFDVEVVNRHQLDCLPGARIGQAISPIATTYPTHNCVWGHSLPVLAPPSPDLWRSIGAKENQGLQWCPCSVYCGDLACNKQLVVEIHLLR